MITKLESSNLEGVKNLQILDLSRNGITSVLPATFRDLKSLKYLDLSLNSLRTVIAFFFLKIFLKNCILITFIFRSKMML